MARNQFTIEQLNNTQLTIDELTRWFASKDFELLKFDNGNFEMATTYGGSPIYRRSTENKGYKTYAKEAFGGSLLVFEINLKAHKNDIKCYAPMQLFGFIKRELSFKENASWITKYQEEGYAYMVSFENFIQKTLSKKELVN